MPQPAQRKSHSIHASPLQFLQDRLKPLTYRHGRIDLEMFSRLAKRVMCFVIFHDVRHFAQPYFKIVTMVIFFDHNVLCDYAV